MASQLRTPYPQLGQTTCIRAEPEMIDYYPTCPTKNSDILTEPLNPSTVGRQDINVNEGSVKMSGFIVTP